MKLIHAAMMTPLLLVASCSMQTSDPIEVDSEGQQRRELSYGVGYYLGQEVREGLELDGVQVDTEILARAFVDGLEDQVPAIDEDRLDEILFAVHEEMERRAVDRLLDEDPDFRALADANLAASQQFHTAHARQEGVTTLESGVQYSVVTSGSGSPVLETTEEVVVNFEATRLDGTQVLEGSGELVELDELRVGPNEILRMMRVGDRWSLALPPGVMYGLAGEPPLIGPNETLLIDVELVEIR